MSTELVIAGILIFFSAFVGVEALFSWWNSTRSPQAKRIAARLESLVTGGIETSTPDSEAIKRRIVTPRSLEGRLSATGLTAKIHRLLVESATQWSVVGFLIFMGLGIFFILLLSFALRISVLYTALFLVAFLLAPFIFLTVKRSRRIRRFESQMPAALDMIGRALRAGHSFPSAIQVAGDELSQPIGPELKLTFEEINYGIAPNAALENLSRRVASQDLSFFVIAAMIQRETGGNLAEVLDNISSIIRERLKLFGKIRAISAEGKISALVLSCLPIFTAFMLNLVNPDVMSLLWTEDIGIWMIYYAVISSIVGILWMTKIVKIHV